MFERRAVPALLVGLSGLGAALAACGSNATSRSLPVRTTVPTSSTTTRPPASSTSSSPAPPRTTTPSPVTTTSTSPPSTTATSPTAASLVPVLQQYLASGCGGGCTQLNEQASAFTVTLDPNDASWAKWTVNDPSVGAGYGFAHYEQGDWQVVAGPGSSAVGCPGASSATVPAQVLADLGATCP